MTALTTHEAVVFICLPHAAQVGERESCAQISCLQSFLNKRRRKFLRGADASWYLDTALIHIAFLITFNLLGNLTGWNHEAEKPVSELYIYGCASQMYCTYTAPPPTHPRNQMWYLHLWKWDTVLQHGKIKPTPPPHLSFDFLTLSRYHCNYTLTDPIDVGSQLINCVHKKEYWVT